MTFIDRQSNHLIEKVKKLNDFSSYVDIPLEARQQKIENDLASLFIEAGGGSLSERINYCEWIILDDGSVREIDEQGNIGPEDVRKGFNLDDERFLDETLAAFEFVNILQSDMGVASLSPSGGPFGYKEGRLNMGFVESTSDGKKRAVWYGIPLRLKEEEYWSIYYWLTENSNDIHSIKNLEDLRAKSFSLSFPDGINPWDFIEDTFPLQSDDILESWEAIKTKQPQKKKVLLKKDTKEISQEVARFLESSSTEMDVVTIGAYAEMLMIQRGYTRQNPADCPGFWNLDLLHQLQSDPTKNVIDTPFGVRMTSASVDNWVYEEKICDICSKTKKRVGPCGICDDCEKNYD